MTYAEIFIEMSESLRQLWPPRNKKSFLEKYYFPKMNKQSLAIFPATDEKVFKLSNRSCWGGGERNESNGSLQSGNKKKDKTTGFKKG